MVARFAAGDHLFVHTSSMKTPEFDISVIIVTFNNGNTIRRCLTSLSRVLAHHSAQVCIIDNASTDATPAILQDVDLRKQLTFAAVQVICNPVNVGYTKGINQGLQRAKGRFVLMLNPDVIFATSPFERLIKELKDNPEIGVVSPQFRFLDEKIQPSCRRLPRKKDVLYEFLGLAKIFRRSAACNAWRMPDFDHQHTRDVDQPQGAFLLTTQQVLGKVGFLDESFPMFFSDVDWCRRVMAHEWRIRFIASVFVYHLQGASVKQKRAHMIVSSHQSFVAYFRKYDISWRDRCTTKMMHVLLLMATPLRLMPLVKQLSP
jgi:GT2 family glycosyltransferase